MKEKTIEKLEQNFMSFNDSELLLEIAQKNKAAFEEFFKRYANKVKFLMLKMGAKNPDAEEISQEVMAILWRKADLYDPQKSVASAWLYTIARNYRIDLLRKGSRLVLDKDDPTFVPDPQLSSVQILIKTERNERIRLVLNKLSQDRKQLLMAAFFEGLTHAELAKKFKKPLGTIKSSLRLIYDSLRKTEDLKPLKGSDD
jgi:RNA polymerase sigma-70 factor (ECF subfamily)